MASIFFRRKKQTGLWWIKARFAQSRALVRSSLQTRDEAMAQLLKRRIELELELRRPELAGLDIPVGLLAELELATPAETATAANGHPTESAPITDTPQTANSTGVAEAIVCYYRHCEDENSPGWLKNKISYLRAFFGSVLVDSITECKGRKKVRTHFKGKTVSELTRSRSKTFWMARLLGRRPSGITARCSMISSRS